MMTALSQCRARGQSTHVKPQAPILPKSTGDSVLGSHSCNAIRERALVDVLVWSRPPAAAGGVYAGQCLLLVASSRPGNEDPTLDLLSRNVYLNKMLRESGML